MQQTPRLTLGYLHHAAAVGAAEQLEAIELQSLPYLKVGDRRTIVARLQRAAAGRGPETPEEERARKEARWDASWARLRGMFGGAGAR
jgi:hypothetical protein